MFARLFGLGSDRGSSKSIAFEDLQRDLDVGRCALIDVREAGEFRSGHVPGSQNLPLSRFDPAALPKGKTVLICQSGMRSDRALAQARSAGRSDVVHFAGGVTSWRARGGGWR